jgi:hypothetical protein
VVRRTTISVAIATIVFPNEVVELRPTGAAEQLPYDEAGVAAKPT